MARETNLMRRFAQGERLRLPSGQIVMAVIRLVPEDDLTASSTSPTEYMYEVMPDGTIREQELQPLLLPWNERPANETAWDVDDLEALS